MQKRLAHKRIVDKLSKKYNRDPRVIEQIVNYPFLFCQNVMSSGDDERAVRLRHLGTFALKPSASKVYNTNHKIKFLLEHLEHTPYKDIDSPKEVLTSLSIDNYKDFLNLYRRVKQKMKHL